MKFILLGLCLAAVSVAAAVAQTATPDDGAEIVTEDAAVAELLILDAAGIDPEQFLWDRRIVAVLAHSPNDPSFVQQLRDIRENPGDLLERDVVVLIDSDRSSDSLLRRMLRPRGFMLAIIEKDGEIKQRRPAPRDVREISAAIDHFPMRRQEILERRPAGR